MGGPSELVWYVLVAFIAETVYGLTIVDLGSRNGNGEPYARKQQGANGTSQFIARSLPIAVKAPFVVILPNPQLSL